MNNKELFAEVYEDLVMLSSEDVANQIFEKYDAMENNLKFSNSDILKSSEMEQLAFPTKASEFKDLLEKVKSLAIKANRKDASDAVQAVINMIPQKVIACSVLKQIDVISDSMYEKFEKTPTPESEPKIKVIKKIILDFIDMNEFDKQIKEDIQNKINYFSNKIRENELRSFNCAREEEWKKSICLAQRKLAAYYNLNMGNKFELSSPEITCQGNRAIIELSLYNAFVVSIIRLTKDWKYKIFDLIDKNNIAKRSQYDIIYKAVSLAIASFVNKEMNAFIKKCITEKEVNKYILTSPEKIALEELYLTMLNKKVPLSLR